MSEPTRREFISDSAKVAFAATIVPRHVLGGIGHQAPSDTLNVAVVGLGQQGTENIESIIGTENLVAVCDVDMAFSTRSVEAKLRDGQGNPREIGQKLNDAFAKAARYSDFRVMLERQRDIDAVVVATPDHLHAVVAKTAMELGKHVFVQKPLTWSVQEARTLQRLAKETRVVTQMGNQGHSRENARRINEWVQAGLIGPVREVHVWTNRPIWPQGLPWPVPPAQDAPLRPTVPSGVFSRTMVTNRTAAGLVDSYDTPKDMNWDLYLGPVKEPFDFHPIYHPFNWRGWVPFGAGALGDMGAHLIDHPYWALNLGYPTTIEATSTPWGGPNSNPASFPLAMTAHYEFPARGDQPPVRLHWYDGGLMPERPAMLPETVALNRTGGVLFVGDRGLLMHDTYGDNPRLFPETLAEQAERVPQTYARIEGNHQMNWVNACKGEAEASSPFAYAAPLTEVMLLGIVALRAGQGRRIHYDAQRMEITNVPEANAYLTRDYREGWSV